MRLVQKTLVGLAVFVLAMILVLLLLLYLNPGFPLNDLFVRADVDKLRLPTGFEVELFTDEVPGARSLTMGQEGTVFVGTRGEGKVYAVVDADGDGRAEQVHTIAEGLKQPNGVAFREGDLFVAEVERVLRYGSIESQLADPPEPEVIFEGFPDQESHGWKYIGFAPDDMLYVTVGVPCNICRPDNPIQGTIVRMNPDGSGLEIFAAGLRNSVGFDWNPSTGEFWFTDNGRDWLGSDLPPDELNRASEAGLHFGFPYVYADNQPDPEFEDRDPPAGLPPIGGFIPPVQALGPHVAALGMRFYDGQMFPAQYQGDVFIAEHGSWNRIDPIGYRVTRVRIEGNEASGYETFASGWLEGRQAWGRPVDVEVMPDGALLVSDDRNGAIYRIAHR